MTTSSPSPRDDFERIVERRFSRREALRATAAGIALTAFAPGAAARRRPSASSLGFTEVRHGLDEVHEVSDGHTCEPLIAWGDPVVAGAAPLDVRRPDPEAQSTQFGHGNDFVAFLPHRGQPHSSTRGLLAVNHEHSVGKLMWAEPGAVPPLVRARAELTAQGLSVVEVTRVGGSWSTVHGSRFGRRITGETPMRLSGPAAGHARLATSADRSGGLVLGTFGNCSGGTTPWGTVLSGEENIHEHFGGAVPTAGPEADNHRRMGMGATVYDWAAWIPRFDMEREPNEPNRFGWVVEVDPHDPDALPVKRTALGRFKHEAAATVVDASGRLVVYLGDDERGQCLYRYVSDGVVDLEQRSRNGELLDRGVLSVARFESDGSLRWLPLVFGEGPLIERNGFRSQADVLIECRRAAELLGGTPLDRPEDVEANPVTGLVYAAMTNNTLRGKHRHQPVDAANPRPENRHGHVVELIPPGEPGARHHAASAFRWELFLLGGDPGGDVGARAHPDTTVDGWLSCPDNLTFDSRGRLWIATDGMGKLGLGDGLYGCDTAGEGRALTRQFFRAPRGAEVCGPCFTPDDRTLFLAVQHPGNEGGSTFAQPSTRWPDFSPDLPPRPAVMVAERLDGGPIG
ncbi:PhoX family protein [Engelhardtia mirabilis]|uniref:Phosphatase n=1 Tax=Engelhardtia mirabilis TaxID=2528011 RepID=A0A518BN30_9BACT|nr:hypothetical protein Pla133_34870 [Planctomycetes bacterium Pla133]QDV02716.1 hypothetical protein Pla86_34850 [Planctomycetes bacterium Pla86]